MTDIGRLERRWIDLWNRIGAKGDPVPRFHNLVARYGEPGRHHHGLGHIESGLDLLDAHPALARDRDAVEFAWWLHDAFYDPSREDNEELSAGLAVLTTIEADLPESFSHTVADLILATRHRGEVITDPDTRLLVDIDLSILGQPESVFDEYERNIWKEYEETVPVDTFRTERARILREFLERPFLFETSFFRTRYEAQARRNVTKSLALLESARIP